MQVQKVQNNNYKNYINTNFSKQSFIYNKTTPYSSDSVSFTANPTKEIKAQTSNLTPKKIEEFVKLNQKPKLLIAMHLNIMAKHLISYILTRPITMTINP